MEQKTTVFILLGATETVEHKKATKNEENQPSSTIIMKMNNVTMHLCWHRKKGKNKRNSTNRARVIRKSVVRQNKIAIQPNQFILCFFIFSFFIVVCRLTNHTNKQVTKIQTIHCTRNENMNKFYRWNSLSLDNFHFFSCLIFFALKAPNFSIEKIPKQKTKSQNICLFRFCFHILTYSQRNRIK